MRVATVCGIGAGLVVGLSLPRIVRYLRTAGATLKSGSTGTHAVRAGLEDASSVRVAYSELVDVVAGCLVGAGASRAHAELTAELLVYADARGIPSHGVNRADLYANEIEAGVVDGEASPVVERSEGATALIDGRNALGAVVSRLANDTAIAKAREFGVGVVVAHRSNHFGAAGFWASRAMAEGFIGLSFTNTAPFAVPTGGRNRAVGTNPFCCFAPGADGDSFQLDMATSTVPIGKIEVMDRIGKPLPHGWGVDRSGAPCTDAAEVCKHGGLYPLGGAEETAGYKGYGLGMFIELVTAVLSGAAVGPSVQPWVASRSSAMDFGQCFIVIDPARFAPGFEARLQDYMAAMRALPGSVRVPGDVKKRFEAEARERGVTLHGQVATALKALAGRYGVAMPREFDALDEAKSRASLYK